jgi:hypothetical protein
VYEWAVERLSGNFGLVNLDFTATYPSDSFLRAAYRISHPEDPYLKNYVPPPCHKSGCWALFQVYIKVELDWGWFGTTTVWSMEKYFAAK